MMILESTRVSLRAFKESDLENLRTLDTDPDIMKFTPAKIPQTLEQTKNRLMRYSKMDGVWAAELKNSKIFIGWFMLIPTELEFPEIGFMIVKKYWGMGLASEVAGAIIDHALHILKHKGVAARTNIENHQSISVLKKLQFLHVRNSVNSENDELMIFLRTF
ncbi:MAG: GNAT family N-acetyltransferase [Bacteriovorax sp.]